MCKCMLIDVNLKIEIIKNNNKCHENVFRDILTQWMTKVSKWPEISQKVILNLTINAEPARVLKYVWSFWSIRH